jgi:ferric-dicitrate binding protein FerR (iron transport regulator)
MRYADGFGRDGAREVELAGEAYFEVSKGRHPFTVRTAACDVEVYGTTFNISAYGAGSHFEVALIEGSLRVIPSPADGAEGLVLSAGSKAGYAAGRLAAAAIDDGDLDAYRWREGLLCFEGVSFGELAGRMEKCFDVTIINLRPGIESHILSGKLRLSDGVDNAMRVLQKEIGCEYVRDAKTNIIHTY